MCSKMTRMYSKFISDMSEKDVLLRCLQNVMPTYCFKVDLNNMPRDYVSINASQDCPSDRMVSLVVGLRRADYSNHLVTMTGAEYNTLIRHRSGFTQEGRMMSWRNYIIDKKLMWKLIDIVFKQIADRTIEGSYVPSKTEFMNQATYHNGRQPA
jgi:hypothetical protein